MEDVTLSTFTKDVKDIPLPLGPRLFLNFVEKLSNFPPSRPPKTVMTLS